MFAWLTRRFEISPRLRDIPHMLFRDVKWDDADWRERVYTCQLCIATRCSPGGSYYPGWTFEPLTHSRPRTLLHLLSFHNVPAAFLRLIAQKPSRNGIRDYYLPDDTCVMRSERRYEMRHDTWRVGPWDSGVLAEFGREYPDFVLVPPGSLAEVARPVPHRR